MFWRAWGGWLAAFAWVAVRLSGREVAALTVPVGSRALTFLYFDWSWLLAVLAAVFFAASPPSELRARLGLWVLSVTTFLQYAVSALSRYYAGDARAWDLANYVQPMWRAAHGLSMTSEVYDGAAVWADHGALAMFAFAPLTRVADDAATGLLVVQAFLAAAAVFVSFALARALSVPVHAALVLAVVHASSRALLHAATFDFHPECAFPLLFLCAALADAKGRFGYAVAATLVAAGLREMAALTMGMLWLYWALRDRRWRAAAVAAGCFVVGGVDMLLLPRFTGWASYVVLNTSTDVEVDVAVLTTALRLASTSLLGWLHPAAWMSGAPWVLAAAMSPKLAVKGIDFHYGFLHVPVATLGAAYVLRLIARRRAELLVYVSCIWLALALATNAPKAASLESFLRVRRTFQQVHERLLLLLPREVIIAADACAAPYVMERPRMTLLCRIDLEGLRSHGTERWDERVPAAFEASSMLVRGDCPASRTCAAAQVDEAQRRHGFTVAARVGPFVVLRRAGRTSP